MNTKDERVIQHAHYAKPDTNKSKLESLPSIVAGVYSNDNNMQLEATTHIRKLLSIERSPPIEEVIQSGVVPRFGEFLMREDFPQLQIEAAWALTNIASGTSENTKVVIDDVREQAVSTLGNVAGAYVLARFCVRMSPNGPSRSLCAC